MSGFFQFLWRGLPAYVWVGVLYAIVVAGTPAYVTDMPRLEAYLASELTRIPLLSGSGIAISFNTIFVASAFVAIWIEVIRATNIRDRAGNDWLSLVATFAAILIFVGAEPFGTMGFLVVPLAGFGDLLLDRMVGQAVARRDFSVG